MAEESKEKEQWQSEPLLRLIPKLGEQSGRTLYPHEDLLNLSTYKCQGSMMDLSPPQNLCDILFFLVFQQQQIKKRKCLCTKISIDSVHQFQNSRESILNIGNMGRE